MLKPPVVPIEWLGDRVRVIDQRELPGRETHLDITRASEMADAIRTLAVRGAPLIGVAAAMGAAVEALAARDLAWDRYAARVRDAIALLGSTRPTASNLFWALKRMSGVLDAGAAGPAAGDARASAEALAAEALRIFEEDLATGRRMGEIGSELIADGMTLLTHCNAGGLATAGYGTALAPMYVAKQRGIRFKVFADETRPLLQGARLTAWELQRAGVDVTVVCDSAAHSLLARGKVDLVFVGSDRITLSGDFANKIGTYGVALSAKAAGVPFYVVAPVSTIDFGLERGDQIPIEERDPREVTDLAGVRLAPQGVAALNPAFDVTPHHLVTGIITERGLATAPFKPALAAQRP
ncbi:MAG: S-methyl-5-thioribose-1-phosphate isomerase [bacterium]